MASEMSDGQEIGNQPVDEEADKRTSTHQKKNISALLLMRLAFQSLGVVYGDLGTSPLYVFYNTFPDGIEDTEDVVDALSLIIYSLTLIPLIKYVFIVCQANDNGQGGTFALYSLICRHAKLRTLPNQDQFDEELTTYSGSIHQEQSFAASCKRWLENHGSSKKGLLALVLIGCSMVIGDGILTPAISVLSATGGIRLDYPKMTPNALNETCNIMVQIGLAGSLPQVVFLLVSDNWRKGNGWTSLGGIMLCITGTEALFADLSQFPVLAIQIAFTSIMFPCLLLAYTGQAAYLMKKTKIMSLMCSIILFQYLRTCFGGHIVDVLPNFASNLYQVKLSREHVRDTIYWPVFVVATAAAIVASQATISATFSLIKQATALGCFQGASSYDSNAGNNIANDSSYGVSMALPLDSPGIFTVMSAWHYGTIKCYQFEMHNKVSIQWIIGLGPSLGLVRVPGVGLVYSPEPERFLVTRVGPKSFHILDVYSSVGDKQSQISGDDNATQNNSKAGTDADVDFASLSSVITFESAAQVNNATMAVSKFMCRSDEINELEFLAKSRDTGVVHILGKTVVMARRESEFLEKLVIDYIYSFLRKMCREPSALFNLPHECLLNVGQVILI
ncbi:hypothetical protein Pint_12131 [Pistacia integerrima]|uniref:Uncharacterized protein n=1 Tax=Pistacia integerrima TaxID=434235 RepID=A0ACC0XJZ8_9ROSI|nr:hypothetical protein Pint_12131 [Pistacia integerrima]